MEKKVYEIWLSLACTPDSATFPRLLERFKSAEDVYGAEDWEIRSAIGSKLSDCTRLVNKDLTSAQRIYNFCITKGVGLLSYFDAEFPEALKAIKTPPVLLYYRGKLPDFNSGFYCAIVGTRSLSDYGRINAFRVGYDMGMAGATIVSGMAIGIDGVALAGALAAGAKTVAVLGSGIDVCYPPVHLRLAQEIVKEGCVITEYAPGTRPDKQNFPKRNRIISGLCKATVVVEGSERSGALITATYAKEQGRKVYAFPGNIHSDGSQLTNALIKNGASLCEHALDIAADHEWDMTPGINYRRIPTKRNVNMAAVLSEYKVSAVAPSDDIYRHSYTPKEPENKPISEPVPKMPQPTADSAPEKTNTNPTSTVSEDRPPLPVIDAEAIRIYKKIPMDVECDVESLVDDKTDLRAVMKLLLKLQMSRFVIMLPGDKVKRNLK